MRRFIAAYRYRIVQMLLLMFGLISLVPLAVLSLLTVPEVSSVMRQLNNSTFLTFAGMAASEMDLYLNERLNELKHLAQSPLVVEAAKQGGAMSEALGLPQLAIREIEERFSQARSLEVSPAAKAYLGRFQDFSPFAELFITDKYGHNATITHLTSDFVQSDEEWWRKAFSQGTFLSSVKYDESAKVMGLEMAMRVEDPASGAAVGVIKGIFDLTYIDAVRAKIRIGATGHAVLVDTSGRIISHPDERRRQQSLAQMQVVQAGLRGQAGIAQEVVPSASGEEAERRFLIAYTPIPSTGWVLLVQEDVAEAESLRSSLLWGFLVVGVGVLALILVIGFIGAVWFSRPIRHLISGVRRVAGGDFGTEIDYTSKDEFGQLADAFNHMTRSLRNYIDELQQTTAAKERVESQLKIAREIQESILPKGFPPFPERQEIQVFALSQPAREMGGDFYDYFLLDGNKLGLVIADVSDKGVPAALFMAITKTMLKSIALKLASPSAVLREVNHVVARDNEKCMFVTIFYGVVDLDSGIMVFANAGHNLPYIIRRTGEVERVTKTHGIALGVVDEINLDEGRVALSPGDRLVFYTDGITEAPNLEGMEFGEDQLVSSIRTHRAGGIQRLCQALVDEVMRHQQDLPQHDDITCLVFHSGGPSASPAGAASQLGAAE